MAFQKGQSGNPNGRRPGSVGERSKENITRALKFIKMIEAHPNFETVIRGLNAHQLSRLYKDMIEFVEPRLSRITHEDPDGNTVRINVSVRANSNPIQDETLSIVVQEEQQKIADENKTIVNGEESF